MAMQENNDIDEKKCWEVLGKVVDPELQLDIVSLGLIYKLEAKGSEINIDMTMTSPGCPLAAEIIMSVQNELLKTAGVEKVNVNLVWSSAWTPDMMNEDAKAVLGIF
jgi:metal-sulfur cluster biosynthetic enzyme